MGDRANIIVCENPEEQVCLYTHWRGTELPDLLRKVLKKYEGLRNDPHARITIIEDAHFLAHVIYMEMIKDQEDPDEWFAISQKPIWAGIKLASGHDSRDIIVDVLRQTVTINGLNMSFQAYIDSNVTWRDYTEEEIQASWKDTYEQSMRAINK